MRHARGIEFPWGATPLKADGLSWIYPRPVHRGETQFDPSAAPRLLDIVGDLRCALRHLCQRLIAEKMPSFLKAASTPTGIFVGAAIAGWQNHLPGLFQERAEEEADLKERDVARMS